MRNSKFKSLLCILTWTNFSLAVSPVFTHWDRGLTTFWDAAVWLCTEFFYHIPGPESRVAFEVEIWQLVMTSHDEVHSLMCLELYWRVRIAVLLRVAVEVFSSSVQVHPERFRTFWKPLKYSCENKLVRIVWWCRVHGFANYRISFWNCLCEGRPLPFEVLLWVWYSIEGLVVFEWAGIACYNDIRTRYCPTLLWVDLSMLHSGFYNSRNQQQLNSAKCCWLRDISVVIIRVMRQEMSRGLKCCHSSDLFLQCSVQTIPQVAPN